MIEAMPYVLFYGLTIFYCIFAIYAAYFRKAPVIESEDIMIGLVRLNKIYRSSIKTTGGDK